MTPMQALLSQQHIIGATVAHHSISVTVVICAIFCSAIGFIT